MPTKTAYPSSRAVWVLVLLVAAGALVAAINSNPKSPLRVVSIGFDDPIERRNFLGYSKLVATTLKLNSSQLQFEFLPIDLANEAEVALKIPQIVRANPTLIVTANSGLTREVQRYTRDIPIVFHTMSEPTDDGLVETEGWPRTNATGVTSAAPIAATQLELLLATVPKAKKLLVISDKWWEKTRAHSDLVSHLKRKAGLSYSVRRVHSRAEARDVMSSVNPREFDAWFFPAGYAVYIAEQDWIDYLKANRIAAAFIAERWGDKAGLITYEEDLSGFQARQAEYIIAALQGRPVSEMAVYRPTGFRLSVNVARARELGVKIPDDLILSADRVVR